MSVPKKRTEIVLYAIILILPIIDFAFNMGSKEIELIPLGNNISFQGYNETEIQVDSLKSTIDAYIDAQNFLNMEYQMKGSSDSMYAGVFFYNEDPTTSYFNLERINRVYINIEAKHGKRIPVFLISEYTCNILGKDTLITRPFETYIKYTPDKNKYVIDLNEFTTPNWWFAENGTSEAEIGGIKLRKITSINIENCKILPAYIDDKIVLSAFKLYADNTNLFIRDTIFLILAFPLTYYIFYLLKKRKIYVSYKPTGTKQKSDKNIPIEVTDFIAKNYMNPDMSLEWASKELGISTLELSKFIKEKCQLSFKKYLNEIRITEVKRLLEKSDLSISEIAFQVGYNNISHFNRIFKAWTNISPKEYRKKYM